MEAPLLNPEVAATITDTAKKRDKHFSSAQECVGSALVALGSAISTLFPPRGEISRAQLLQNLCDTRKLLTDLHHQHSVSRRAFVLPGIEMKSKTILEGSSPGKFLFGEDLGEELKSAKSIDKLGLDSLNPRQQVKKAPLKPQSLN